MPLLPVLTVTAPAPLLHDTRISMEDPEESLNKPGPSSRLGASSDAPVASGDSRPAVDDPGDGGDVPEDSQTQGSVATVSPDDNDEIRRQVDGSSASFDSAGRTPLHACVAERLLEPFKELLTVPGSADARDASGWPLLHVALLHGWHDGVRAALDAGASVDVYLDPKNSEPPLSIIANRYPSVNPRKFSSIYQLPIEIAMQSGDMEMFETVLTFAQRNDAVNCFNRFGKTALSTAISANNLPAVQALLRRGAFPHRVSSKNESALHVAVRVPSMLKYFLDYCPDVTSSFDNEDGLAPIHVAVKAKIPESVKLLLDKFNDLRIKSTRWEHTPLHVAAYSESNEAAEIILKKDLGAMDEINWRGDTPLHTAVKHNNRDLAAMLLQKGGNLSTKDEDKTTVLELISTNFYDAPNFLKHVFDNFIYKRKWREIKFHVNYQVLTDGKDISQINMLEEFVRCGLSKALTHPLMDSLLYLKWMHFRLVFYYMVLLYEIFLISFNIVIIDIFCLQDLNNSSLNTNSSLQASPMSGEKTNWLRGLDAGLGTMFIVLTYITMFQLTLQESFFIYLKWRRYFGSVESWVKLTGLVLCAVAPPLAVHAPGSWSRHVACVAVLLTWLQIMFLVSRFPRWGYYVLMFGKVIVNMFKIFVTAIFLVIGFSLCFMIQYRSTSPFDNPFTAFVKTLVMMTSEFDYKDLFDESHDKQLRDTSAVVRILFLVFVIIVSIVLMTFMTGMAVSDINDLHETGNIKRIEKQVELLRTFEALVCDGVIAKWFKNFFSDKRYHESMYIVRGNKPKWQVKCRRHPDNIRDRFIYPIRICPSELHCAIVDIANKNDQCKTEKSYRCKVDTFDDAIVERLVQTEGESEEEEVKEKDSDIITLKNEIKSLVNDLSQMLHEIKDIKCSYEHLNKKISHLPSDISKSITDMSTNIKCSECRGNID